MRRILITLILGLLFSAGFAMADPAKTIAPSLEANACDNSVAALPALNPMEGAVFLAPPNGCTSICSASHGRSCSPNGSAKSCFDVSEPDGCLMCLCEGASWVCFL